MQFIKSGRATGMVSLSIAAILGVLYLVAGYPFAASVDASGRNAVRSGSQSIVGVHRDKISPSVLSHASLTGSTPVIVMLESRADTSAARSISDWNEKGWYVYKTLKDHAEMTQSGVREFLDIRGIKYQAFWASNMIAADLDQAAIMQLAERADVDRIDTNLPTRWIDDPEPSKGTDRNDTASPVALEWGITNVRAPEVWDLGFKGQGIVVGDLDTGVRWTHEAIKSKYRGWNGTQADHNYNWWDSVDSGGGVCGANNVAPCDDNGHGTHTVGTVLGEDGANQIGVAPDAKWIGCRNMNVGAGTPASYTECFQFMIAPTDSAGNNPDPSRRPHVLNNSWSCPVSEGCTTGGELEDIIKNTQNAGIFVVVSAGNSGPGCSVLNPPGHYSDSFSVGAIDSSNMLASFSGRGPSTFYDPSVPKPNLSAPGVTVRSAISSSDVAYGSKSGTSMAGPHVAGVIALLWSARPSLIGDIDGTKAILQNTANPSVALSSTQTCGGISSLQVPNNSFGYGRVDAFLATINVELSGRVLTPDGNGLRNATVTLTGPEGAKTVLSSSAGFFKFQDAHLKSSYTLTIKSKRYRFLPVDLTVSDTMTSPEIVGIE